ncbi:hypothetical protein HYV64_00510 [Candidatus Shapirobacteria bacterium]|nr:hypothetical protein [Candidatus Shapirobacteria bacterium]
MKQLHLKDLDGRVDPITASVLADPMRLPRVEVGQEVEIEVGMKEKLGTGKFVVERVVEETRLQAQSVGHSQMVELNKTIDIPGVGPVVMVYDSFEKAWVKRQNLSHFGKVHPTVISAAWIKR